ncbi:MAG: putative Ribosomal small subunit methyltransferase [Candidatus Saccharibacteria bacterium]|nr:putative Ribosomal small subunit methyltransferase [Candidatus Saccharibacteria bacterium]
MTEVTPRKSLGQHWLHDQSALQAMVAAAQVESKDMVVEIGPGLGTLTQKLVEQAREVLAIELDERLATDLPRRVPANNLTIANSDILKFDFTSLPADYKIVANIPYYLTAHLLRILSESPNRPASAALLLQKEVAQRVTAKPGQMSLLSVNTQLAYQTSLGQLVPAKLFTPPPKVDSQILILTRRPEPLFKDLDTKQFFRVVKAGFANKRKTLLNTLSAGLQLTKEETASKLQAADINPQTRPQELSLEQWHRLYQQF